MAIKKLNITTMWSPIIGVVLASPFIMDIVTKYRYRIVDTAFESVSTQISRGASKLADAFVGVVNPHSDPRQRQAIVEKESMPHTLYLASQFLLSKISYDKPLPTMYKVITVDGPISSNTVDSLNAALGLPAEFKTVFGKIRQAAQQKQPVPPAVQALLSKYKPSFYWAVDKGQAYSAKLIIDTVNGNQLYQDWYKLCDTVKYRYSFSSNQMPVMDVWNGDTQASYLRAQATIQLEQQTAAMHELAHARTKSKWMNQNYFNAQTGLKKTNLQLMKLGAKPVVPQQNGMTQFLG